MSRRNKKRNTNTVYLDSGILERDFSYQRPVRMEKVNKIVAEFNPLKVNTLKVSLRDGHYYVFDGSHTLEVLKIVKGKEHFPVECKLYRGLTYEMEAELFAAQDDGATRVGVPFKIRALAAAGDEEINSFLEATRSCGYEINPGEKSSRRGNILAVSKAYALYKSMGAENYKKMLNLLKSAWHGECWSVSQNMLSGMALLIKTFGDKVTVDRFSKKLGGVSSTLIQKEASKVQSVPVSYQYAFALTKLYNSGGAKGTLPVSKLTMAMVED
jgi:hypothetical protein